MENLLSVPIKDDIYFIGTNDRKTELFEGMWPLPKGVAYNSFVLKGEKNILFDLVRVNTIDDYIQKINEIIGENEKIDYIVINHMEPDHTSSIKSILDIYPDAKLVTNKKAVAMLKNFYEVTDNIIEVKEGETLELGNRKLTFYMTPMVHWPESMVAYEETTKTLFSQDIFGGFGTLDGGIFDDQIEYDAHYHEETTRYFINIV